MTNWEMLELILKKPLEDIVDIVTGKWKCGMCETKKKFISEEKVHEALKEKKHFLEKNK